MKRLFAILLACILLFSLTACSAAEIDDLQALIKDLNETLSQLEEALSDMESTQAGNNNDPQSGSSDPQDIDPALYERWHTVVGYWNAAEGRFAVPDMEDSHSAAFRYGMWQTEFDSDYGRVIALTVSDNDELSAVVAWGDEEKAVIIDDSGLDRDGKIRIKIGEEDWLQYMYAGATADEALQTHIDNTTGS